MLAEQSRSDQARPAQLRYSSYVQRGMYTGQLRRIWANFPVEQTLILRTDDLGTALAGVLARIASFLEVRPFVPLQAIAANARGYEAPMGAADRRYLAGVFEEEIRELERLLGLARGGARRIGRVTIGARS